MKRKNNNYLYYLVFITIVLLIFHIIVHDLYYAIINVSFRLLSSSIIAFILSRLYYLAVNKDLFFRYWLIVYLILSIGSMLYFFIL